MGLIRISELLQDLKSNTALNSLVCLQERINENNPSPCLVSLIWKPEDESSLSGFKCESTGNCYDVAKYTVKILGGCFDLRNFLLFCHGKSYFFPEPVKITLTSISTLSHGQNGRIASAP